MRISLTIAVALLLTACGTNNNNVDEFLPTTVLKSGPGPGYDHLSEMVIISDEPIKTLSSLQLSDLETADENGMSFAAHLAETEGPEVVSHIIKNFPRSTGYISNFSENSFWSIVAQKDDLRHLINIETIEKHGYQGGNILHFIADHPKESYLLEEVPKFTYPDLTDRNSETPLHIAARRKN
jgi:hypothetical protein